MPPVQICVFNPVTTLIDQITAAVTGPAAVGVPVVTNSNGLLDASLLGTGASATAGQNMSAGQLVNLYNSGGTLYAQIASAQSTGTAPSGAPYPLQAQGFVNTSVFTSNTFTVNFFGTFKYIDGNSEFSAANIGQEVYLSAVTPGGITRTPPAALEESVGYVISFTSPNIVGVSFIAGFLDFSHISGVNPIGKGGTGASTASQALINLIGGSPTTGQALIWSGTAWVPGNAVTSFSDLTSGTNTVATMVVGGGATLTFSASGSPAVQGVVNANKIYGVAVSSTPPTAGQVLTATSATAANWQTPLTASAFDHPGLTASFGPQTLTTPTTTGTFRVSIYEECTVAGASGGGSPFGSGVFGSGTFNMADDNVQSTVTWTDDSGVRVTTPIPTPLDLANTNATSGDLFIRSISGQPIVFQTFLAAAGSPTYGVFVRLEPLG